MPAPLPPEPLDTQRLILEPLAVERLYLDNYFSIDKARRDLGYEPLFTTDKAMSECVSYYVDLFQQMKNQALAAKPTVAGAR